MASFPTSVFLCFSFFTFYFKSSSTAHSTSSFSFTNFGQNSSFTLHGDAKVVNNGSSVQLTAPLQQSSAGRITYKNPIKFYSGIPNKTVSFSTYFSFSVYSGSGNGDGLAFVVFADGSHLFDGNNGPFGLSNGADLKFFSVEFDTLMNHVGIDLSNFVSLKVANLSIANLGLNSGTRLQVWIDYESGSKRLEVRLNKFGENRPVSPLLFERIDLSKIWHKNERFYVGLSSSNGNSSQVCNVYSWSFTTRQSPGWMHSEPLDPIGFKEGDGKNVIKIHKKNDCVVWVLFALILGIGLGALGSFVGMFMWTILAKRRPVTPEEYAVKHVDDDNKCLSI
ncbi:putative non-specific serine/threonine protein kinase [Helianthus annuus]|nr:putative non-specific serine/threonine protein kinase [Helianthus annuus]